MAFLRSMVTTSAAIAAASVLPPILALSSPSSSSSSSSHSHSFQFPRTQSLSFEPPLRAAPHNLTLLKSSTHTPSALHMDTPTSDLKSTLKNGASLPELLTEFMVDMKCEGCVTSVKNKLQTFDGVKNIEVDLSNQVVRVLGTTPVKVLSEALEQTGRKARLIGQGVPDDFLISAAVAEFKGPDIFGVVRFAQVNMELVRVEATFSGLTSGKHGWSINEFGDLTRGAASTGKVFNPFAGETQYEPLGDLGTLNVDEKGEAFFSGTKKKLRVADLIGRSVVVYVAGKKAVDEGIVASVIARSAGVGENYKKLCTCDGTTIWESSYTDIGTSKV